MIHKAREWIARERRTVLRAAGFALVLAVMLLLSRPWWDEAHAALVRTHAAVFVALLCVLPLVGVSIVFLQVIAGARFGGEWGIVAVAVATLVHLVLMHVIARRLLRKPVERMLRRRNLRIPTVGREEPVSFSLLGALVPGIPYFARNYLLALSGVPFRIYAAICWPVHVIRSGVAIYLGDWATDLSPDRIALLAAFYTIKLGICAAIVWHLRRKRAWHHAANDSAEPRSESA